MLAIAVTEADAGILREVLEAKLTDLSHEISHTDSRRFRATLTEVDGALRRLLEQLPARKPATA